jgi:hypothetical protein
MKKGQARALLKVIRRTPTIGEHYFISGTNVHYEFRETGWELVETYNACVPSKRKVFIESEAFTNNTAFCDCAKAIAEEFIQRKYDR